MAYLGATPELVGPTGPTGLTGSSGSVAEVTLASYVSAHPGTLSKGMPVCLISGQLRRATSLAAGRVVFGLVFEDTLLEGVSGRVQTDCNVTTTTAAWDLATGLVGGLAAGSNYYLSSTGAMTTSVPSSGEYLVLVGMALSSTTFRINLSPTVLL